MLGWRKNPDLGSPWGPVDLSRSLYLPWEWSHRRSVKSFLERFEAEKMIWEDCSPVGNILV